MTPVLQQIGGYRIDRTLAAGASYIGRDERGQRVVLKRLESDCLMRGQLHPSIRDRLMRVRELALKSVATLRTVERADDDAWLVWDYIDGDTFDDYTTDSQQTSQQLSVIARELVLSVDALHGQGIIHGAIHGRNVILTPDGQVRLTHVSPLLYNDPAEDVSRLVKLLRDVMARRPSGGSFHESHEDFMRAAVTAAGAGKLTLRELARRLADTNEEVAESLDPAVARGDRLIRWKSVAAASLVAALGAGTAVAIYRATAGRIEAAKTPPNDWGRLEESPAGR